MLIRRCVVIVQARMRSTRLPGKVLMNVGGEPMLGLILRRLSRSERADQIVVATSEEPADDPIASYVDSARLPTWRGSEHDVLDRLRNAAVAHGAEIVVRITADCPLVDPALVDRLVAKLDEDATADFASTSITRSWPRGVDVEVSTTATLDRAWREASEDFERVHVFPYVYRHPELFRIVEVQCDRDLSHWRWTVDTPADLEMIRRLIDIVGDPYVTFDETARVFAAHPELLEINASVRQKELREC